MFFHGENSAAHVEDFRPEVHDSDGLLLNFGSGEWLWRPLDNPRTLRVSTFRMTNPRGFGLLQRDRDFDHYQDLETRPELRPSVWVAPQGDWGEGRVELVEIPTKADTNDNIVAYWVPDKPPEPGEMRVVRLHAVLVRRRSERARRAGASSRPGATAARSRTPIASSSTSPARSSRRCPPTRCCAAW